ncbi:MAG TPA: insulinase family protein [Acidobacteria bacterium]|nr:insulinase family protein [Acidobacteriota bacterium]
MLDNGLQVRMVEMPTAPLVSVWCWYRVGSKDERPGQTGVSHWVEHMNFKGTFYAYWVMNNVLGQYGIGGRLGRSIRERQGMAYCAGSMFEAGHIAGPLLVRAGVNADNVDRALDSIETEVADMARDGATDDEVSNAKRYLVGSIPRSLETNAGIARFLQTTEQFGLGLDHDRALPGLVDAVSVEAVADAARQTLRPEQTAIVIAGP